MISKVVTLEWLFSSLHAGEALGIRVRPDSERRGTQLRGCPPPCGLLQDGAAL